MPRLCFLLLFFLGRLVLARPLETTAPVWEELPTTKEYVLRSWEVDDGLPHNRVMGITQTPDGYLWVATPYGLTRFDGVRFTPFWEKISADEAGDHVYSVFAARDGALWIGLIHGGVGRWHDGHLEIVVPDSDEMQSVNAFAEDADGAIWFSLEGRPRAGRWKAGALTADSSHTAAGRRVV